MKIKAERTEGRYLKPGDFFSDKGPEFWSKVKTVSAECYLCVNEPDETDKELVYKIIIERERSGPLMNPHLPPGVEE
jgi:hypothetical protein